MKPFSLEEYLKNPTRRIITRGRMYARVVCTDAKCPTPILCLLMRENGYEFPVLYHEDGKFCKNRDDVYDLFFFDEKKEGWINLYENMTYDNGIVVESTVYPSKSKALKKTSVFHKRIATIKIKWEE